VRSLKLLALSMTARLSCVPEHRERQSLKEFVIEEAALVLDAPSIAGHRAVGAERAMAWYDDRERVRGVGMADGTCGAGTSEPAGDFAIGAGRAPWNRAQLAPCGDLKGRRADIDRERDFAGAPADVIDDDLREPR